jgi:hypothetical protein
MVGRLLSAIQFEIKAWPTLWKESYMLNTWFRISNILALLSLCISGCAIQTVEAQPASVATAIPLGYQIILGKSVHDQAVVNFLADNHCSTSVQFELCKEVGMSFWIDSNQQIGTAYLYSGNADGFQRYRGKMPYGITFYDPMWLVQEKLSALDKDNQSQKTGLPDEADSPDHIHYWAAYKQLGLVLIYDTGIADPDAYIYAVLVSR